MFVHRLLKRAADHNRIGSSRNATGSFSLALPQAPTATASRPRCAPASRSDTRTSWPGQRIASGRITLRPAMWVTKIHTKVRHTEASWSMSRITEISAALTPLAIAMARSQMKKLDHDSILGCPVAPRVSHQATRPASRMTVTAKLIEKKFELPVSLPATTRASSEPPPISGTRWRGSIRNSRATTAPVTHQRAIRCESGAWDRLR